MKVKVLVILFLMRLYARLDLFNLVDKKHGQDIRRNVKTLENLMSKAVKIQLDLFKAHCFLFAS